MRFLTFSIRQLPDYLQLFLKKLKFERVFPLCFPSCINHFRAKKPNQPVDDRETDGNQGINSAYADSINNQSL